MLGWFQSLVKYFSSSISKKIIIPYAVLTLILAALGVFIVVELVAGSFEARLKNQLRESAQIVSDEIVSRERLRLEIERVVANTIGVAEAIVDRDTAAIEELVAPVIANARIIDSIILVDTQGKELIRFQRQNAGASVLVETEVNSNADLSSWPAVQQVLADKDGYKTIQLARGPELDELIIYTVGPVQTDSGTVGAALVGTYLRNELAVLQNLALAQLTLFDDDGQVLATTFALDDDEQAQVFDFFTPERYAEVMRRKQVTLLDEIAVSEEDAGLGTLTIRDQGYRLAFAPFLLRQEPFGIYAVALPTNFITHTTNQYRNILIAVFSAGVVTVFAVGFAVSRRISQPILKLVQTALAISSGDLDRRTGLNREDEIGILATTFDDMTTELQRLLQVQAEEASKLNAILNSIADGVIVQDNAGNILIMNPAADRILQEVDRNALQSSLKVLNQEGRSTTPAGNQPGGIQADSLLEYLEGLEFLETHRFEIGRQVLSALSAPVKGPDDNQLGAVVVLRDITREYESEKLKDDFITSISHELRTPLTAIKGYNDLLKMVGGDQLNTKQLDFIGKIGTNVDDLLEIIQQMLDLSQIDGGTLGIDREPLDLTELVEGEAANWTAKMEEREMHFSAKLPSEPVWVRGDEERLTRVIHNLIKNAHDYTLPGGQVTICLKHQNGTAHVDVTDTGVGISSDDQRFLFTRFFRAIHEESTFEVSGAGLGLYTSKAIIEAHGGSLSMQSKVNEGSVFSFSLAVIDPEIDEFDE